MASEVSCSFLSTRVDQQRAQDVKTPQIYIPVRVWRGTARNQRPWGGCQLVANGATGPLSAPLAQALCSPRKTGSVRCEARHHQSVHFPPGKPLSCPQGKRHKQDQEAKAAGASEPTPHSRMLPGLQNLPRQETGAALPAWLPCLLAFTPVVAPPGAATDVGPGQCQEQNAPGFSCASLQKAGWVPEFTLSLSSEPSTMGQSLPGKWA